MVETSLLNNCVAKGGFGPGTILRRIMYGRELHDKKLLNLVHETTKTPREVFGSHCGESQSLLLVEVAMTPPLPLQQAITCATMPIMAAGRRQYWGGGGGGRSAAATFSLAARWWHQDWHCGGGVWLGSAAAARCHWGIAAPATTTAMLPPRAAAVAMKTPAATAMAGAQTINNQLKARKQ